MEILLFFVILTFLVHAVSYNIQIQDQGLANYDLDAKLGPPVSVENVLLAHSTPILFCMVFGCSCDADLSSPELPDKVPTVGPRIL